MTDHSRIERQVSAMHREIASRLRAGDLTPIARAGANLDRWRMRFGGALPAAYLEWQDLLEAGIEQVLAVLEGDDEDAIRRRSSSPFPGVLTARERWEIMRRAA